MAGKLTALITEACRKQQQLQQLESDDGQLSTEGYTRAIIEELGGNPTRAAKLAEVMATPEGESLRGPFMRLSRAIKEWKRTSVIRKLRGYFNDESFSILVSHQWQMADMYLCAAKDVAARHPELFGRVANRREHQDQIDTLRADLNRLSTEIRGAWTAADVDISREDGKVFFRCTNGEVQLHPIDHLAERLVNWQLQHGAAPKRKAA
jgi:hypothetical protein